jgi:uncharacterized protein (TIGR00251 family)
LEIENLKIAQSPNGINFQIKVVPASSKTCFEGIYDDMLKVKLSAAPEKGKANKALVDFLAEKLGIKKKFIKVVSGQTSKTKKIAVEQITPQELLEKLRIVL